VVYIPDGTKGAPEIQMTETDITRKVELEIRTLFSLTVVNLVVAALALAMGVGLATSQITSGADGPGAIIGVILSVIAGLLLAGIGIRWLISVADVLDGIDDVKDGFEENRRIGNGTGITATIIQMMATYRLKRPTIHQMAAISKAAGILFAMGTFIQGMLFAILIPEASMLTLATGTVGLMFFGGFAIICLTMPGRLLGYTSEWDEYIANTERAEVLLKERLGGLDLGKFESVSDVDDGEQGERSA